MAETIREEYASEYISSATTTQVATGRGTLVAIVVTETAAGTITVSDSTSAGTPVITVLKASIAEGTYTFNAKFAAGLRITTGAASKITVIYQKL